MPQPVVSRRYLFLCSPPKVVVVLSPASAATSRKLTPRAAGAASFFPAWGAPKGDAREMTSVSGSTTAVRQRDRKNERREGDKRFRDLVGLASIVQQRRLIRK